MAGTPVALRPVACRPAMGIEEARGRGSMRSSLSILNTPGQAVHATAIIKQAVVRLRRDNPRGTSPCGMALV